MTLQFNRCSMVAMISPDMLWPAVGVIATLTVILCLRMMALELANTVRWQQQYAQAKRLRREHDKKA
jgi:hypothetical protein